MIETTVTDSEAWMGELRGLGWEVVEMFAGSTTTWSLDWSFEASKARRARERKVGWWREPFSHSIIPKLGGLVFLRVVVWLRVLTDVCFIFSALGFFRGVYVLP